MPFLCECGEPTCELFLPLALHTYDTMLDDREWLLAAGHTVDEPGPPRAVVDHREQPSDDRS